MTEPNPNVDPLPIWQILTGFQLSAAFKTAVELELFTHIGAGNTSPKAIADACGAAERGIRPLADAFTVVGFLSKSDGNYTLTELAATFLDKRSPMYIASAVEFIMSDAQLRGFQDLTSAVRNGGSQVSGEASLDPNSPMWVTFAKAMMPLMVPAAMGIAANIQADADKPLKVLDIAAGHGIFGITIAKQFPNAEIFAVDWPNVLTVATENAERMGVADRLHLIPGSAFEVEFGIDFDIVLVTNFLHHFDPGTCTAFMSKVHRALKPDGRAMTLEFVPNEDRVSPPGEALFSLIMLAATPSGDAYTFNELKKMFEEAGFGNNTHIPMPPTPQHLIISSN
ncbi:MAG: type 12 methyltransferase [Acidobacteria bacterium OLB17]|nr:MAG: type 12 methyltransferase [Acidobacteria bacterium OLB17]MCZ2392032.1 methyltransferase domain-containing protein [Acidobacteriota bacterium]